MMSLARVRPRLVNAHLKDRREAAAPDVGSDIAKRDNQSACKPPLLFLPDAAAGVSRQQALGLSHVGIKGLPEPVFTALAR
jgi:hypothetical protein